MANQLVAVMRRDREFRKMMNSVRGDWELESGMSWGSHAELEQARLDARFLAMTEEQWREHLRTDRSQSVEEVARLRALRQQGPQEEVPMPVHAKGPAYWFHEYVNFPHLYFSSEAEQKAAIAEVLEDWSVGVGRWRLAAMERATVKIQQWWAEKLRTRLLARTVVAQPSLLPQHFDPCEQCGNHRHLRNELCQDCGGWSWLSVPEEQPRVCRRCGWDGADVQEGLCWECVDVEQTPLWQWVHEDNNFEPDEAPLCHGCGIRSSFVMDVFGTPLCQICRDERCEVCGSFAHTNCKTQKLHYCMEEECDGTCGVQPCGYCIDTCRCSDGWRS